MVWNLTDGWLNNFNKYVFNILQKFKLGSVQDKFD